MLSLQKLAFFVFVLAAPAAAQSFPTVYCTAKTGPIGCEPAIGFSGTSSASTTSGFTVNATRVRNAQRGLLFYGVSGRAAIPFLGATLCTMPPLRRTPQRGSYGSPITMPACDGFFSIDMNRFAAGRGGGHPLPELSMPGTVVTCQWWNHSFSAPFGSGLSNALEYTVGL